MTFLSPGPSANLRILNGALGMDSFMFERNMNDVQPIPEPW